MGIGCHATRRACSFDVGATSMTDTHEQVFREVQRRHITAPSPTAQRCRLAASRKLQEELDGRAGSSDPQVAAKTPQDDHYSL